MALYTVSTGTALAAQDVNQLINLLTGADASTPVTVSNRIRAITPAASLSSGYVGGTTGGAPVSGTFLAGDFLVDQLGFMWVCVAGGTPGTWYRQGSSDYFAAASQTSSPTSVTARTGQTGFDVVGLNTVASTNNASFVFNATNHTIAVPFAGYYLVSGIVGTTGTTASWSQAAILLKNGAAASRGTEMTVINGGDCQVIDLVSCAANDTFSLAIYSESACTTNVGTGHTQLSVCLIT